MTVVKTYAKGQIIIPKDLRMKLGIKPGKRVSLRLVDDHLELRPLPDDPIEFITGILKAHPGSLSDELLGEREKDNDLDEQSRL
ncbi:MAG: AbrB/MazE/SpoVT family DNA-binding domain-containing protein [Deltaproteobacteria bacterium]|nr:AbrB/MazE/SpoVT family DNA-binding domain-containing protein [Deltaproteobacteria bacterium]